MTTTRPKNNIEKFLNLFTEVKKGEGRSAILLFLSVFLILTSYYIMKPVREALILTGGGAEIKSYASAGQALLFLGIVPLYARLAGRFPRRQLINSVTCFFVGCLAVFYILALIRVPLGVVFFLWLGIFNMMVVAQFWAFANDIYTPEAGKRIFVIIAFGASSGAVLGGMITDALIEPLGVYQLLLVAGALLLGSLILTNIVDSRDKADRDRAEDRTKEVSQPFEKGGAFSLVFKTRYLLFIALLMLFTNWVNTTGEYILGRTVQNRAEELAGDPEIAEKAIEYAQKRLIEGGAKEEGLAKINSEYIQSYTEEYIGNFYAKFYTGVNLAGLLIQLFLVSRILKYLGIRIALLVLPFIALCGYFVIAFIPVMTIIRWAKTAENSTDYSLQNTVRHALFLPTTREEKYKAKQATDTFFVRAGDVLSAVLVYIGTTWLAFQTSQFALFCIGLVVVWFALAVVIGIENKNITERAVENPMV
ncbi:MAG: MFS transporter [Deltaproteobacteria bacterium]|nr:MFS transporter [Deltaproteobacteria bacterium]